MSLVAIDGTPIIAVGQPSFLGATLNLPAAVANAQAAANAAVIMYGHVITDDGGSHTLDTTGSSSLTWRSGAITFANAGSTFKLGLATVDASNGPPARATNAAGVVTFSASKSIIGGSGGIAASATQSHTPDTGSIAIANGDFLAFATQLTTRGGADSVTTATSTGVTSVPRPGTTTFDGTSTYTAQAQAPNVLITFSDGHLGWFYGGNVYATATTTQSWANNSAAVEYGNLLQFPFPLKVYGIIAANNFVGDCDIVLYSDPLGTPVAEKTISVDLNTVDIAQARYSSFLFASPYTLPVNTPIAAIMKPTSTTSVSSPYKTFNAAAHQVTEMCGTNGYAVNRASGAFTAQNSNKDRFAIGLLIGAFDNGAGSSGMLYIPNMDGV